MLDPLRVFNFFGIYTNKITILLKKLYIYAIMEKLRVVALFFPLLYKLRSVRREEKIKLK